MALRSPALWMGNPAVQHTSQNDRLLLGGLFRSDPAATATSRPLAAASGALFGPAGTRGEVTLLSNTQFTVNPARWIIQASASALGGAYEVTNDAVETLAITAQDASQFRRSYFGVWVSDSFVAGSGDDLPHRGLVDGALAASSGTATLPSAGALPANFLALGEFLIPPVGSAVTWTPYSPYTVIRGAVLPVTTEASVWNQATGAVVTAGAYDGQQVYALDTKALGVWDATAAKWRIFDTQWQFYTPTLGSIVSVGSSGSNNGKYFRRGRAVDLSIYGGAGAAATGWNAGSGNFTWSLPPGMAFPTAAGDAGALGLKEQNISAKISVSGVGTYLGYGYNITTTALSVLYSPTGSGSLGTNVSSTSNNWANGGNWQIWGTIMIA